MRNPARLAAQLSGRPLLMREASLPALARQLGIVEGEKASPLATFFGRARRALASRHDATEMVEPSATAPRWVGDPDHLGFGWVLKDGVGILEIEGPLMAEGFGWDGCWYHGYDTLRTAYEEMAADGRVGAIWEVIRSPGGVVDSGLPELAALKRSMRATAGGKPIHSFLRDGFSAAYWVPSASDRIDAARESGVGSIGAVVGWCGMAGMLEKEGFEYRAFKFGARKTDGSPFEPLSDTAAASLQAEIDQCGRWFVADVVAGRPNLTEEAVLATEAGCFFGDSDDPELSGRAKGLVDQILTERESFAAIRELAQTRLAAGASPSPAPAVTAPTQETEMKRAQVLAAAKKAGLSDPDLRKLSAELPDDDAPADEAEGEEDEVTSSEGEGDQEPTAEGEDGGEGESEAQRISGSPEAKTHPGLALAAISTGQSFAQFQANVKSAGAGGRNQLASTMAGSPRLGADAAGKADTAAKLDPKAIYGARKARARKG